MPRFSGRLRESNQGEGGGGLYLEQVVAVAYERWSFKRSSNYRALTGKNLVFWIGGRLWEVVPYERWSHMEVRLYYTCLITGLSYCDCHRKVDYEKSLVFLRDS